MPSLVAADFHAAAAPAVRSSATTLSAQRILTAAISGRSPYSAATAAAHPWTPPLARRLAQMAAETCPALGRCEGYRRLRNRAAALPVCVMAITTFVGEP